MSGLKGSCDYYYFLHHQHTTLSVSRFTTQQGACEIKKGGALMIKQCHGSSRSTRGGAIFSSVQRGECVFSLPTAAARCPRRRWWLSYRPIGLSPSLCRDCRDCREASCPKMLSVMSDRPTADEEIAASPVAQP